MYLQIDKNISQLFELKPGNIILLIIFVGLILRSWGVWFGLPYLYHEDESHEVIRAMQLGMGSFNFGRVSKGGYFYLIFFEYGIYFIILRLLGFFQSVTDFAYLFIKEPWSFYLIGRLTTALIGTLNVFIIYLIGKVSYSRRVGTIAAIFLALNFIHSQSSHYITVDVPMTCLATIALMYAVLICQSSEKKWYILGFLFAGLATITKAPAGVTIIPLLIAHFYNIKNNNASFRDIFFGNKIIIGITVFLLILFLGAPGYIINFKNIILGYMGLFINTSDSFYPNITDAHLPQNFFIYYLNVLKTSMGIPLLIISIFGFFYGLYRHKKEDMMFVVYVLIFYLMISLSKHPFLYAPHYVIPILPVLAILSSRVLEEVSLKISADWGKILSVIIACLFIIEPGYKIIRHNYLISQKDTRTFAKEWIEKNIPAGSKILIEGSRTKPKEGTVPLKNSRENLIKSVKRYKETEPGKAKYFELELKVLTGIIYDLVIVGKDPPLKDPNYYKKIGIEYFIMRPEMYKRKWVEFKYFLKKLKEDPNVKLIKKFENNPINRPGPTIEIYKIM